MAPLLPSPKLRLKTDNHSLGDKCVLRRKVIYEANLEPVRVLDLFAGEGNIWNELRREPRPDPDIPEEERIHALRVERYTPIDQSNRQAGQIRFKITPRLIESLDLESGLARYNVIDVDTYGDPWEIWRAVLYHITQPTAVFLTRGKVTYGAGRMPISNLAKKVMGIPASWDVPGKIELLDFADRCQLLQTCPTAEIQFGYWLDGARVDYYGVFVVPKEKRNAARHHDKTEGKDTG